jgi:LysR family glycine cleavage system transcriptional activator
LRHEQAKLSHQRTMGDTLRSLSGLIDFECAARWSSFKRAALELHKTPAAVSQNMRQLEAALGFALFQRQTRGLVLTEQGAELAATVTRALKDINLKVQALREGDEAMRLRVSATHSFAMKWLVPRLHRFNALHPGVDLRLESSDQPAALGEGQCDVAIRYLPLQTVSAPDWLWREQLVVVYSPRLPSGRDAKPDARLSLTALTRYPLLYEGTPEAWMRLLARLGMGARRVDYARSYSHAGLLVQAAVAAHGMALAPYSLAHEDLAQGRLSLLAAPALASDHGYKLLCEPGREALPRIACFRDWMAQELVPMQRDYAALGLPD